MPLLEKEIWYCTCGAINRNDREKCYNCRRNRDAFQKVNYETLKADARKRADAEKQEEAKAQKKKKDKGRLLLKIAMVILPILLAAVLIFSTVPPFLARREAYSNAQTLLSAGKYEEAQEMFAQLGDYLDAKELAEKGVQYQKAMAVFEGAKKADPSVLPLVGLTRNDVADTEDLSMLLYTKAKELLEPLGNYQEAEESISKSSGSVRGEIVCMPLRQQLL